MEKEKIKVLFVCMGNICRSPLGAAILKEKIKNNGMERCVEVDSCGTSNYHIGDNADPRTIANAAKHGIPMEHCVRQLVARDLQDFHFIFAMDNANYKNILRLAPEKQLQEKVKLMREFDPVMKGGEVPDPYYGGEKDFQEVYNILDRSISGFVAHLKDEYGLCP